MMAQTLISLRWKSRLLNIIDDFNQVPFFQGNFEYLENNKLLFGGLILANMSFLQRHLLLFRQSRLLVVDKTFEVMPYCPIDMHQLVTIHAISGNVVSIIIQLAIK